MFQENHKLLPRPKTTGYQCDMLMAYLNATFEYTTQGCVVTLCCAKRGDNGREARDFVRTIVFVNDSSSCKKLKNCRENTFCKKAKT